MNRTVPPHGEASASSTSWAAPLPGDELLRAMPSGIMDRLACAWCWKPLKGHGRRHSLVGIWRRRLAQLFG